MGNECLLNRGDDNGEIGAVATEWAHIKLTRADAGDDPGDAPRGQLLSGCPEAASLSGWTSDPVNNSRQSYRGKQPSSLSALFANAAVLVCTCRPSSTLAAIL